MLARRRKALVLGERVTAQIIGNQLAEEGFDPVFQTKFLSSDSPILPKFSESNSLERIRSMLARFSESVTGSDGGSIVHPGTTFWAERPELPILAQELGLQVVGPSARILTFFGNRLNLLMDAERAGVPNLVQSFDPMHTVREIQEFVRRTRQNYPFVLKAVKGGGNSGLQVIPDARFLERDAKYWFELLRLNHGEVILFAEKYLEGVRHVMVPFVRFQDGRIRIFPSTDASLQCRYRKLIEMCPAHQVGQEVLAQLESWVTMLSQRWGYVGVGIFEFLVDGSRAFLVDGLARLNTDFHLWEKVAGTHAVYWQMAALENNSLRSPPESQNLADPQCNALHGMSVRIYAEDSVYRLPQPGLIDEVGQPPNQSQERPWDFPSAEQSELDLNYQKGEKVSLLDSGLVGILWVASPERRRLIPLAIEALQALWIAGSLQTNERFLLELLNHPWIKEEIFHTGFIDEEFSPQTRFPPDLIPILNSILLSHPSCEPSPDSNWIVGDQWVKPQVQPSPKGSEGGPLPRTHVFPIPIRQGSGRRWLVRLGAWFVLVREIRGDRKVKRQPVISAVVSGRVHAVLFRPGVSVSAHEPLVIIESLGLFVPHALPLSARVLEWKVDAEDQVFLGQELAEIEVYKPG